MRFLFEQKIQATLERVWQFHANPANIMLVMRERRGFGLMRHDARVAVGGTIWFQEMVGGCVPMVLGFRHAQVMPGSGFVNEMIHGLFKPFIHRH